MAQGATTAVSHVPAQWLSTGSRRRSSRLFMPSGEQAGVAPHRGEAWFMRRSGALQQWLKPACSIRLPWLAGWSTAGFEYGRSAWGWGFWDKFIASFVSKVSGDHFV